MSRWFTIGDVIADTIKKQGNDFLKDEESFVKAFGPGSESLYHQYNLKLLEEKNGMGAIVKLVQSGDQKTLEMVVKAMGIDGFVDRGLSGVKDTPLHLLAQHKFATTTIEDNTVIAKIGTIMIQTLKSSDSLNRNGETFEKYLNAQNIEGKTAMQLAKELGNNELVAVLKVAGAADLPFSGGVDTWLHDATTEEYDYSAVEIRDYKISSIVNIKNSAGQTALEKAVTEMLNKTGVNSGGFTGDSELINEYSNKINLFIACGADAKDLQKAVLANNKFSDTQKQEIMKHFASSANGFDKTIAHKAASDKAGYDWKVDNLSKFATEVKGFIKSMDVKPIESSSSHTHHDAIVMDSDALHKSTDTSEHTE